MKDFDFDELDRAVSSVLTKKDNPSKDSVGQSDAGVDDTTDQSATSTNNINENTSVDPASDDNVADTTAQTAPPVDSSPEETTVTTTDGQTLVPETQQSQATDDTQQPSDNPTNENDDDNQSDNLTAESDVDAGGGIVDKLDDADNSNHDTQESTETSAVDGSVTDESEPEQPTVDDQSVSDNDTSATDSSVKTDDVDDESSDEQPDEDTRDMQEPAVATSSLASIPVKRGKFMDVMSPASGTSEIKKPIVSRGVTLSPSSRFSVDTEQDSESAESSQPDAVDSQSEAGQELSTTKPETTATQAPEETPNDTDNQTGVNPFIPDVPVEKRPLNALSPDTQTSSQAHASDTQQPSTGDDLDQTIPANIPKEFAKDIMAIEANETVGVTDETHTDEAGSPDAPSDDHSASHAGGEAMAAATAEPHPVFDTSTLGHATTGEHHSSKMTWVVVGVSLFVIGAALGVLYFLYGQA